MLVNPQNPIEPGSSTNTTESTQTSIDLNNPEIKQIIDQQIASAISGLKSKNDELIAEKRKLQEQYADFKEFDKDTLKNYITRLKSDEEARLIAEGKVDEVINRRTERMRESYQTQIVENQNQAKEWQKRYSELESAFNNTRIDAAIRDAALAANVIPSAIDDIIVRGRQAFQIADGKIISKDPYTNDIRIGSDGKSPYNANDFMADLKKAAPHFWPQTTGGGFTGQSPTDVIDRMHNALQSQGGFDEYRKMREKAKRG